MSFTITLPQHWSMAQIKPVSYNVITMCAIVAVRLTMNNVILRGDANGFGLYVIIFCCLKSGFYKLQF